MRLRGWVVDTLLIVNLILTMVLAGETDNFTTELIVKGIAVAIMIVNTYLVVKYGKIEEE